MTTKSLPQNPSLPQLRKQAKDLLRAARAGESTAHERVTAQLRRLASEPVSLSLAQLTLAREYGFESWPKLKVFVETQGLTFEEKLGQLVNAATTGRLYLANHLLKIEPKLTNFHFGISCLLGDVDSVRRCVKENPAVASTPVGLRSWQPLVYVTHSHFCQESEERKRALLEVAQLLLENGADANATYSVKYQDGVEEGPIPVLYGPCGQTNFPEMAEMLLKAGATPDEKEALYHSTEFPDQRCTQLLLQYGARPGKWGALHHQLDRDDLLGARILLEAGANPNDTYENLGSALQHAVIRGRGAEFVKLLMEFGAAASPAIVKVARRYGNLSALKALGAETVDSSMSPAERFIAACACADEAEARKYPGMPASLAEEDRKLLAEFAQLGKLEAVRLMLDLGFPINQMGEWGTGVQQAAWEANLEMVKLFLARGADLECQNRYGGSALGTALYATQYHKCRGDRFVPVVEAILEAGAVIKPYHFTMGNEAVTEVVKGFAD